MKKLLLAIFVTLVTNLSVCFAKGPIKFGKVSLEELEMTQYDADTSAVAVVLCKYGYFSSDDFTFKMTQRIKILKKAGTSYSTFTFPSRQDVNVRAKVFNLENGEIIDEKVKNDNIYKEKVTDSYYRIKIALPNIKVGTVYDIEYSYESFPSEFAFQQYIPVKHAEIYIEDSPYVTFRKRMVGYLPVSSNDNRDYVSENVPAFKEEAYLNSAENYISKLEFDILEISVPGHYKSYSTSWESVNKRLNADEHFGMALTNGSMYLNDIRKNIEANYTNTTDKIKAAVEAIKEVQWNHRNSVVTSTNSLITAYKDKKANAADINLMLIQLLKKLDIECYPVVLSTRANGILNPFYPSIDKLNYALACAMVDGKEMLLDATETYLPAGMLPLRCLNGQGRLVNELDGKWVDLKTNQKDKKIIMYNLQLDDDLNLNGTVDYARYNYAAYSFRKKFHDFANDEAYLKNMEEKYPGLTIKDYTFTDIDDINKPVKEKYNIKLSNKVSKVGDMVLINPFLFEAVDENPFKMEERQYPVDFGYLRDKMLITKITIPDDYEISEIPEPVKIVMPDKSASALINYKVLGNTINVTYMFKIGKPQYLMDEYTYLKSLYSIIIEKHAEPIIIKPVQHEASL
nr:hypothetical protein [uncultured Carboxylicivirga sp.]